MNEREYDDLHDDNTIEVSDLPEEPALTGRKRRPATSPRRISLRPRWSRRPRLLQAVGTISLVLIALLLLLSTFLPLRAVIQIPFMGPSPTPSLLAGRDLFYFNALPSWGTVLLDGHPLSHIPTLIISDEPPVRLPAGRHLLEWRADPFEPLRCTLVVPPVQGEGARMCNVTDAPSTRFAEHAWLITLPVSLSHLPGSQREALIQATQSLLDTLQSTEIVQPGEHYLEAEEPYQVHTATQPLQATLRFHLDTDTTQPASCSGVSLGHGCSIAGQDCRLFCTPLWPKTRSARSLQEWNIAAIFHTSWQYTTLDGKLITPKQQNAHSPVRTEQFVTLHVIWQQGRWQVSFQNQGASSFDNPVCTATISVIVLNPSYHFVPGTTDPLSWAFTSGPRPAAGCLAAARVLQGASQSSTQLLNVILLRRFGVLLAANQAAHQLWPTLPLADEDEQRLAQYLLRVTRW